MSDAPRGVVAALQDYLMPALDALRAEVRGLASQQEAHVRRLGDMAGQVAGLAARLDQLGGRIDSLRDELGRRIDQSNARSSTLAVELGTRIDALIVRTDQLHLRLAGKPEH